MDSANEVEVNKARLTAEELLDIYRKAWAEQQDLTHSGGQCPECGHCPTCGRGGYYAQRPYSYPWMTRTVTVDVR